ncbi:MULTISPECIES: AraC family transcriptional regulator [unclassified Chitinophaga]|uniref:AraC family transcriptional regulator n=1 Tax=unclassified Chitinophaga TaxID=2619133 RepID=UPI0009D3A029|nr:MULTISPECIES: AraC family transcriptional regulator [unclassified Chitinophaga]OMP79964.1 AraC family transcriptional regulator [[Flexibacter] sp. ATCC 35208]WPV64092.1 AraC family transcriptional regulator [Chitinophaga sp. LS1]
MKVLQFTIPVPLDKSIIVQKDVLPFFYPHLHRHHEIQMSWIQQGEGTLVADNNMHAFRPNDIFWLGANQPHIFKSEASYFQPKSRKKIVALAIFFNPNGDLSSLFNLPETKLLKNFISQSQSGFKVPDAHKAEVSSKMMQITNSSGTDQLLQFVDLLKQLSGYADMTPLATAQKTQLVSEHEGIRIGNIYNYIMQNYDKPITLEDAAKQAHMTPQAFCRFFKKHTLHTFVSFLNEVRINEACKKLTDGAFDNIATVAYTCGFNSITNFNRVFKTVTTQSPSDYMTSYFQSV